MTQIPVNDINRPKPWRFAGEETFRESSPNVSDGLQTFEDSPVALRRQKEGGRLGMRPRVWMKKGCSNRRQLAMKV